MYLAVCAVVLALLVYPWSAGGLPAFQGAAGQNGDSSERIIVKFREGTAIRLRQGELVSLATDDLAGLQAVLDACPGIRIERLFTRPEADLERDRANAAGATGQPQPDLNLYYRLVLPPQADAAVVVDALNRLPIVESAYVEAPPAPPPAPPPLP